MVKSNSDGCGPRRVTYYAHLPKGKPKAFLNVQPFFTKENFPSLLPRDDNNFSLYSQKVRRHQREVEAIEKQTSDLRAGI